MHTVLLGIALLAALPRQDAVRAQWNPSAGTKATYRITNHHPEMAVSWEDSIQVVKVADGKVTLGHKVGEPKVTKDGKALDVNINLSNADEVLLLNGETSGSDEYGLEITFLGGFRFPDRALKKDEIWNLVIPANLNLPKATASSTYRGEEKVKDREALKYDYTFEVSGGASASGTIWLQKSDGMMLKRTTLLKNVNFGGGPEETRQEIERID